MRIKNLLVLVLLVLLSIVVGLTGGCTGSETGIPTQPTPTQLIEDVTPQEAFTLIQNNLGNPDFVILDVRTSGEFAEGHLENAANLDFYLETFRDELSQLDRNETYLIYCRSDNRSGKALGLMKELNFRAVYNMSGGIIEWEAEGLPTVK